MANGEGKVIPSVRWSNVTFWCICRGRCIALLRWLLCGVCGGAGFTPLPNSHYSFVISINRLYPVASFAVGKTAAYHTREGPNFHLAQGTVWSALRKSNRPPMPLASIHLPIFYFQIYSNNLRDDAVGLEHTYHSHVVQGDFASTPTTVNGCRWVHSRLEWDNMSMLLFAFPLELGNTLQDGNSNEALVYDWKTMTVKGIPDATAIGLLWLN